MPNRARTDCAATVSSWLQARVMAEAAKIRLCDPKADVQEPLDLIAFEGRVTRGSAMTSASRKKLTRRCVTKLGRETAP